MTTPRVVTFDWDAFHARVERLRVVHDQRTPAEAVAVSLDAFRRWGVEPPASFLQTHPEAAAVCRPGAN